MARNNHNAGMHFINHTKAGKYDNLSYYEKNSEQGLRNRRYEALAALEALGDYPFTEYICYIKVLIQNGEFEYTVPYRLYSYRGEHEKELLRSTTRVKLCDVEGKMEKCIYVRIHDKQKNIYMTADIYEKMKNVLNSGAEFRLE